MTWQPTTELRWLAVTKKIEVDNSHDQIAINNLGETITFMSVTNNILQQKWVNVPHYDYCSAQPDPTEWRDVETVKETP